MKLDVPAAVALALVGASIAVVLVLVPDTRPALVPSFVALVAAIVAAMRPPILGAKPPEAPPRDTRPFDSTDVH